MNIYDSAKYLLHIKCTPKILNCVQKTQIVCTRCARKPFIYIDLTYNAHDAHHFYKLMHAHEK